MTGSGAESGRRSFLVCPKCGGELVKSRLGNPLWVHRRGEGHELPIPGEGPVLYSQGPDQEEPSLLPLEVR